MSPDVQGTPCLCRYWQRPSQWFQVAVSFRLLETFRLYNETCSSLPFIPHKHSSTLKSIDYKKKKNHIVCMCVCAACVRVWHVLRKIKNKNWNGFQDIRKLISNINSLLKSLWFHFVGFNLPPDSNTGICTYCRLLHHIIFVLYIDLPTKQ